MIARNHLSGSDADRILKRAAELESAETSDPLSVDEIRAVAEEAGYDPSTVERAISETLDPAPQPLDNVQTSGFLATRFHTTRSIPVQLTAKELMKAVELLMPYFEAPPEVKFRKGSLVWRDRRKLRFELDPGLDAVGLQVSSPRLMGQKARWKDWVGKAADQLEAMIRYAASERAKGSGPID